MTKPLFPRLAALLAVLALASCGNDPNTGISPDAVKDMVTAAKQRLAGKPAVPAAPSAETVAAGVAALEAAGQPIYLVRNKTLGVTGLMGILGTNGDVITWSTPDYHSVSMRDGIVIATRGFGPDLMSAVAPTVQQLAVGKGTTKRRYYYLDGADQSRFYDYDCSLAVSGTETIGILGRSYATRKITETCNGQQSSIVNEFWFDSDANLRQSSQLLVPGVENLLLQRIID